MHKLEKWMNNSWIEENNSKKIKDFLFKELKMEEPFAENNHQYSISITFSDSRLSEKINIMKCIAEKIFETNDFFLCEYGVIGIDNKYKYIKGHPNKEECIEYESKNEDVWYCYNNITYCRINKGCFRFKRYIKDVVFKNHYCNDYVFVDIDRKLAVIFDDYPGILVITKDKKEIEKLLLSFKDNIVIEP